MLTKKIMQVNLFICSLLICPSLFATTHSYKGSTFQFKPKHFVISLGGGKAYSSDLGHSQTFQPAVAPGNSYAYDFDNHTQSTGLFNAFVGGEWLLTRALSVQAGVGYYYIGSLTAQGTVTQGVDAQSADQYAVKYNVHSQQLLLDTKWLYARGHYHPYFSLGIGGVGGAYNTANDFIATIIPAFTTASRTFEDNNTIAFTYAVGLGLDVDVRSNMRIGIGYRFSDLGKASLGDSSILTIPQSGTLSQSHLYTNEVLAQLTILV